MNTIGREIRNGVLITLGIFAAGFGLKGFLLSSNFIDGGVTGVSMLLDKVSPIPLSFWLPLVNLPFIALGYQHIGRAFAIRSVLAIAGLALTLAVIPFPDVTPDRVLTAVFGGFFIGVGIGLAVRGGAVLDGTEIAALLISKRTPLVKVGDAIMAFNVVLFLAAMSVLGVEAALYSILTYITAARMLNFVLYGLDEYTAVTIVSLEGTAIRQRITSEVGRGCTVYRGYGGMKGEERDILSCVVTRLEVGVVTALVREIDPSAFITTHTLTNAEGGVVRKARHH